jgi:hypothetical protein
LPLTQNRPRITLTQSGTGESRMPRRPRRGLAHVAQHVVQRGNVGNLASFNRSTTSAIAVSCAPEALTLILFSVLTIDLEFRFWKSAR